MKFRAVEVKTEANLAFRLQTKKKTQLQPTVSLHCPITTLQLMHQSHLMKLLWL